MDSVFLTQTEVARRLLNAAIKMFFRQDDMLAVHNVAHSALQIVIDRINDRGTSEDLIVVAISRGLFDAARAKANDQEHPLLDDAEFKSLIDELPKGLLDRLREAASYEDVELVLSVSRSFPKRFWAQQRISWNQLKHARRTELIEVGEYTHNAEEILAFGMGGYVLLGLPMSDVAMRTFHLYRCAQLPEDPSYDDDQREKVEYLRAHHVEARKKICNVLIG